MRVIFIRHGESTSNAGIVTHDVSQIVLTQKGHDQAIKLAYEWVEKPALIAVSPFLRTQETARPTIARFPDVPVKILPMQEFTYLEPIHWNGTHRSERMPHIEKYWQRSDPNYCDGPHAESFNTLLNRIDLTLAQLEVLSEHQTSVQDDRLVLAFSHGQFMQVLRITLMYPEFSNMQKMAYFCEFNEKYPILNIECLHIEKKNNQWKLQ